MLYQRCLLLRQQETWGQFISTGRFLMAMYFKETYSSSAWNIASGTAVCFALSCVFSRLVSSVPGIRYGGWKVGAILRGIALETLRESNWERLVKRMPQVEADTIPVDDIWDIFFQVRTLPPAKNLSKLILIVAVRTRVRTSNVHRSLLHVHFRQPMSNIPSRRSPADGFEPATIRLIAKKKR